MIAGHDEDTLIHQINDQQQELEDAYDEVNALTLEVISLRDAIIWLVRRESAA